MHCLRTRSTGPVSPRAGTFTRCSPADTARDPAVHKLTAEVQHLLKPRSVYQDPELVQRVFAVMAE